MRLERIIEIIFKRYMGVIYLLLIMLGTSFLADAIQAMVIYKFKDAPHPSSSSMFAKQAISNNTSTFNYTPEQSTSIILKHNILEARREDLKPQDNSVSPQAISSQIFPCSISSNLTAIIASDDPNTSYIVYRDAKSSETDYYSPISKNQMPDGMVLIEVMPNKAKIRKQDHIELCVLGDSGNTAGLSPPIITEAPHATSGNPSENGPYAGGSGIKKMSELEYLLEQGEVDKAMQNLNQIATESRWLPSFRDGKSEGFKIVSIVPGSVIQRLGFQNGDVVQKINGYDMSSPDKALEVAAKLRDTKNIVIQVDRRGSVRNVTYQIK